jgi:hypothetical protein
LRRISVVVLLGLIMLALAGSVALAAPPDGKGQPGAEEPKQKGQPENPSGFGGAASQVATDKGPNTGTPGKGGLGEHSSSQEEPRQGVGNVARNDGDEPGDHPGDHGCLVGEQMGTGCTPPGKGK